MATHPEQALTLYHHPWDGPARALRLALGLKGVTAHIVPLPYGETETFFRLACECRSPVLVDADGPWQPDWAALPQVDVRWPEPPLAMAADAWQAVLDWLAAIAPLLARLEAPVGYAWRGLGDDPAARAAHARACQARFGLSLEALANDRYHGYAQLAARGRLVPLGRHLAQHGFYLGARPCLADCVIAAALFPLQLLDGIALPIHLLYYLRRVQETAGVDLAADLSVPL